MRKSIPRSLPFNISRPLLNFLGAVRERSDTDFIAERLARAMLGQALERAAVRHGFIERTTERVGVATRKSVVPFVPTGAERQGYKLTRHGRLVGAIGMRGRQAGASSFNGWEPFIREAQFTLDEAIRESNVRVA